MTNLAVAKTTPIRSHPFKGLKQYKDASYSELNQLVSNEILVPYSMLLSPHVQTITFPYQPLVPQHYAAADRVLLYSERYRTTAWKN